MKKNLFIMMVMLLVIIQLAGCSSKKTETAPATENAKATDKATVTATATPATEQKNVNLKFSIWGNDTHKKMYEDMIVKFNEKNPNIHVEIMTIPFADYQQKLTIMQASKDAPDLAWLADRMIPQFLSTDQLLDISAIKTDTDYKFGDFYPATFDLLTKDGKIYGVPFSTPPSMIYYNKTLFKEKGLTTPTDLYKQGKWNYEEYLKAAKALTNSSKGIFGAGLFQAGWANWPSAIQSILNSYGVEFLSKDGSKFLANTPDGEKAFQMFSDMIFKDKVHPKPGDQTTFDTGKIAMQKDLFSYMGKAKAIKDFEWDIAPLPAGPKGAGTTIGYGAVVAIKDTKYPAEAQLFLKYITSPENMIISSQYFVPSRKSVLESDGFLKQGPSTESVKLAVIDQMNGATSFPSHKNWQKIDSNMKIILDLLYSQTTPVKDVLKKAEETITPLLK